MNYDFEKLVDAAMNYKPPIEMIASQIEMQKEGELYRAVQRVGFNVDKEELKKALMYDRNQYEEGFKDGLNACKWIPCSERLPEDGDCRFYMCIVENHEDDLPMFCQFEEEYGFGFWHDIYDGHTLGFVDSEFRTNEELGYEKVIAWQQLPAPYKPKGER